jgi:hypothetical protein
MKSGCGLWAAGCRSKKRTLSTSAAKKRAVHAHLATACSLQPTAFEVFERGAVQ